MLPVTELRGLGRSARRSVPGPGLCVDPELGLARGRAGLAWGEAWRLMSDSSSPLIPMESGGGPPTLLGASGGFWLGLLKRASAEKGDALTSGLGLGSEAGTRLMERSTVSAPWSPGACLSGRERLRTLALVWSLVTGARMGEGRGAGTEGRARGSGTSLMEPEPPEELRSRIPSSGLLLTLSPVLLLVFEAESRALSSSDLGLP